MACNGINPIKKSMIKKGNNRLFCKISTLLSDFFFINLSLVIATLIVPAKNNIPDSQLDIRFISHAILALICVCWFLVRLRHYTYRRPFWFELKEIIRTIVIFSVLDLALVAFSKWQFSRSVWFVCWGGAIFLVPIGRMLVRFFLNRINVWKKQTIIFGAGRNSQDAMIALNSEKMLGFNIIAFFDPDAKVSNYNDIPVLTSVEELWLVCDPSQTQIIVAFEYEESEKLSFWIKELSNHACRSVTVIPSLRGVPLYGTDVSFIFSYELILLRLHNNLAKQTSRFLKRAFDLMGSLFIIILTFPVLSILYFLVSRDGGSAIYGHERIGMGGRKFNCYKFRSMVVNSQDVLDELLSKSTEARAEWEKDFKLKNDPRITKIGHFLRKTSLDELPQLFNVLLGEMSLVGPRPIVEVELIRYENDVDYYLMAKPGMTGLWQVSGRNNVDYETRVYFDSWYVKNWSLWNDIVILFKTINVVLRRDGAY